MGLFGRFTTSVARLAFSGVFLVCAASIPAYFAECGRKTVSAAGFGTPSPLDISKIYLDSAKISPALEIARAAGLAGLVEPAATAFYAEHPQWLPFGGKSPVLEAFYKSLPESERVVAPVALYSVLATHDVRAKLAQYLLESENGLVRKLLSLRTLNTAMFPPAYTSAGAPFEASLLSNALFVQSGVLGGKLLREISALADSAAASAESKEAFEKYSLAVLTLAKTCDWATLASLMPEFSTTSQVYDFARAYGSLSPENARLMLAASFVSSRADDCAKYLAGDSDSRKIKSLGYALAHGEGSLDFLLDRDAPIYENSPFAEFLAPVCAPVESFFAPFVAKFPVGALVLKVALAVVGGYLFIRGFIRLFKRRRDTRAWYSPLALARGLLEAVVVATLYFVALEPYAFTIKINENAAAPDLRFAFTKVINTIGEETMKFESDTATLAAVALFFVLQLAVYVFSLIRLSAIKRTPATAKLKLQLLENEENLFDLALYIGLAGTVTSLILLTVGIVNASLMAAYASTLFGILFTALIKIFHVRPYKRKLLIEAWKDGK